MTRSVLSPYRWQWHNSSGTLDECNAM